MIFINHIVAGISVSSNDVNIPKTGLSSSSVTTGLKLLFGLGGGIAFLVMIVAGLRFVLTQGDPAAVNRARSAFLFAIVGLVVCAMAFSIVTFVLERL